MFIQRLLLEVDKEWGRNLKEWIMEEAFALALATVVIITVPMILHKSWSRLVGTLAASAIALFFIKSPERLIDLAAIAYSIVFGDKSSV